MKNPSTYIFIGFCIGIFVTDLAFTAFMPGVQTYNRSWNPGSISRKQTVRPKLMYGPRYPLENIKKWAQKRQTKEHDIINSPIAEKNDTTRLKTDSTVDRTESSITEKNYSKMQKTQGGETALGKLLSNFNESSDSMEHLNNGPFSADNDGDIQKILAQLASEKSNDSGSRNEEKQEGRTNEMEIEKELQTRDTCEISEKKSVESREERSPGGYKKINPMSLKSSASVKPSENSWSPRYKPWNKLRSNFSANPLQDKSLTALDKHTTTLNSVFLRADISSDDRNSSSNRNSTTTTEDDLNVQISITTLLLVAILLCCITNTIFCCTLCFTID